jgi:uncharacterized protein (DUF111 family)
MPKVRLTATGVGVGASDEETAFAEMLRVEIGHVAPTARPEIRVAGDDAVSVSVELDRDEQAGVGDVLERLLQAPRIESALLDERDASEQT